jgi:nucleoid DNA-binding protein
VGEHQLHDTRELQAQCKRRARRASQHANKRARALSTRDARHCARRKCLTFTRECVEMHVMEHSNAAFARGEEGSPTGFGCTHRNMRTTFTGCTTHTAEVTNIAASEGLKFTAGAGFMSAVN